MDDDDELDWGDDGPPPPGAWLPPVADTGAERTARYDTKRRRRGEVRVSVWVPADRASELREIASKMRG